MDWASAGSSLLLAALVVACTTDAEPSRAVGSAPECAGKCDDPDDPDDPVASTDEGTSGDAPGIGETEGDASSSGGEAPQPELCWVADVDDEAVLDECAARRATAFDPDRGAFDAAFLRWSCLDVAGRPADERGQEYCEAFAVAQLPGRDPAVLGRRLGENLEDGRSATTLEVDDAMRDALTRDPEAVVGGCLFTAWNLDIDRDAPRDSSDRIYGLPIDAEHLRMRLSANSNEAAHELVDQCARCIALPGDPARSDDPLHDSFSRGCFLNGELNGTQDRKSDSILCAAAMRLGECGCRAEDGTDLREVVSPRERLGFVLGSWQDPSEVIASCRAVDLGTGQTHVVACDLPASVLLEHAANLPGYCEETFADFVVVHAPLAELEVSCVPPPGEPYGSTCDDRPWDL